MFATSRAECLAKLPLSSDDQSIFLGFVMGTLYIDMSPDKFINRLGLMLFAAITQAFGNFSEIPVAVEAKAVMYKQVSAGFYPAMSYLLSVVLLHLPLAILESVIFGS